ncbi:hypothetical protein [Pontiella sp.]|uniref:hypothetical protein n=1 Tax=Pontiella sp. TaxID=2837462 RepID=UPI0035645104
MKPIALAIVALAFASIVNGEEVSVCDGVKFNLPAEFILVSKPNPPQSPQTSSKFIKKNEIRDVSIKFSVKPTSRKQNQLEEIKQSFTKALPNMTPKAECEQNEIIKLNDRQWFYFEIISHAENRDIRNIMMTTVYDDQLITFNFNCTEEQFERHEAIFRACIKSISIES